LLISTLEKRRKGRGEKIRLAIITFENLLLRNTHLVIDEPEMCDPIAKLDEFVTQTFHVVHTEQSLGGEWVRLMRGLGQYRPRRRVLGLQCRQPGVVERVPELETFLVQGSVVSV